MTAVDLLKLQADFAFTQLKANLEGVTQDRAWATVKPAGDDYLHTDGSVQGVVLHIAGGKFIYGSVGFRNSEIRWRDVAERMDAFEPSWEAALAYLDEAHAYWLSTWANLDDEDLTKEIPRFSGNLWPAWRIIQTVIDHDSYHAGQIPVILFATSGSDSPPPTTASDIRQYCRELPSW